MIAPGRDTRFFVVRAGRAQNARRTRRRLAVRHGSRDWRQIDAPSVPKEADQQVAGAQGTKLEYSILPSGPAQGSLRSAQGRARTTCGTSLARLPRRYVC